jgi:hypothetical protein
MPMSACGAPESHAVEMEDAVTPEKDLFRMIVELAKVSDPSSQVPRSIWPASS